MNQMTPPPKLEIIPSSAPFSEAQRSWLNGFFAGLLSPDETFLSFARRHDGEMLRKLADAQISDAQISDAQVSA